MAKLEVCQVLQKARKGIIAQEMSIAGPRHSSMHHLLMSIVSVLPQDCIVSLQSSVRRSLYWCYEIFSGKKCDGSLIIQ